MTNGREWRAGTAPRSRAETSEETRGRWVLGGRSVWGLPSPVAALDCPHATGPRGRTTRQRIVCKESVGAELSLESDAGDGGFHRPHSE